jgi:hypothetical protein
MTIETLVPDDLWQTIQPLLTPPPRRYGGRARVDDRACLAGIVYQLHTGIPWRLLPTQQLGCGSSVTCWRGGTTGSAPASGNGSTTWSSTSSAATASSTGPAPVWTPQHPRQAWGVLTGPNPVDRGKPGSKYHLLVDRRGVPLAVVLSAANTHDSLLLEQVVDAVPSIKGLRGRPGRPPKLHLDKATTTRAAGGRCVAVGSPRGSPGAVSSHAIGWAATATWWATGACRSATSGTPRCCSGFCIWRAR